MSGWAGVMRGSLLAVFTPPLVGRLHSGNTCACIHKHITPLTPTCPLLAVLLTAEEQALYKEAHAKCKAIFQQYLTLGHAQVLQCRLRACWIEDGVWGCTWVWSGGDGVGCRLGVLRSRETLSGWIAGPKTSGTQASHNIPPFVMCTRPPSLCMFPSLAPGGTVENNGKAKSPPAPPPHTHPPPSVSPAGQQAPAADNGPAAAHAKGL